MPASRSGPFPTAGRAAGFAARAAGGAEGAAAGCGAGATAAFAEDDEVAEEIGSACGTGVEVVVRVGVGAASFARSGAAFGVEAGSGRRLGSDADVGAGAEGCVVASSSVSSSVASDDDVPDSSLCGLSSVAPSAADGSAASSPSPAANCTTAGAVVALASGTPPCRNTPAPTAATNVVRAAYVATVRGRFARRAAFRARAASTRRGPLLVLTGFFTGLPLVTATEPGSTLSVASYHDYQAIRGFRRPLIRGLSPRVTTEEGQTSSRSWIQPEALAAQQTNATVDRSAGSGLR
ncbi:hypothetical protein [Actinomycetospora sp. CA-084318]|uniref:hypothetical protein n=1 Tax=Actinomycetospora sp. CA-084318 TaxID=3239892 RepID=UPI003D99849F